MGRRWKGQTPCPWCQSFAKSRPRCKGCSWAGRAQTAPPRSPWRQLLAAAQGWRGGGGGGTGAELVLGVAAERGMLSCTTGHHKMPCRARGKPAEAGCSAHGGGRGPRYERGAHPRPDAGSHRLVRAVYACEVQDPALAASCAKARHPAALSSLRRNRSSGGNWSPPPAAINAFAVPEATCMPRNQKNYEQRRCAE